MTQSSYPMMQPMYGGPFAQRMQTPQAVPSYYPQPMPAQSMQSAQVTMVTARNEAESQIIYDDQPHFYANLPAGEIYVKQLNTQTGRSDFALFRIAQDAPATQAAYVTVEEFRAMADRVEKLQAMLQDDSGYVPRRSGRRPVSDDAAHE